MFDNIKLIGRSYEKDNKLYFSFSGSGFSLKCKIEKEERIYFIFSSTEYNTPKHPYISVFINGKRFDYPIDKERTEISYVIQPGEYYIKIIKRTEAAISDLILLEMSDFKYIKNEEKKLKIEVFGDSLTCGYGVLTNSVDEPFSSKYESFTDSYAYKVIDRMNLDYSVVSISGFPISLGRWNMGFPFLSLLDLFKYAEYKEGAPKDRLMYWNNRNFIPDIILINLGANDNSYYTEDMDWIVELKRKYGSFDMVKKSKEYKQVLFKIKLRLFSFFDNVYFTYNNPRIIFVSGLIDLIPEVEKEIIEAIREYNITFSKNNIYYKFKTVSSINDFTSQNHPGIKKHEAAAIELEEVIRKVIKDIK